MTPTPDLTRPDTVILMSPVLVKDYARLLDAALEYMPHPDANAVEGGPRAAAMVEKVGHALADDVLNRPILTIGRDGEIQIGTQQEVTPP